MGAYQMKNIQIRRKHLGSGKIHRSDCPGNPGSFIQVDDQLNTVIRIQLMNYVLTYNEGFIGFPYSTLDPEPEICLDIQHQLHGIVLMKRSGAGRIENRSYLLMPVKSSRKRAFAMPHVYPFWV